MRIKTIKGDQVSVGTWLANGAYVEDVADNRDIGYATITVTLGNGDRITYGYDEDVEVMG
jgi:hypothetical protein